jgi:hypothetical protein
MPRKVGSFPYLVPGSKSKFVVGPFDQHLLPRIFEVAIAKYESL